MIDNFDQIIQLREISAPRSYHFVIYPEQMGLPLEPSL